MLELNDQEPPLTHMLTPTLEKCMYIPVTQYNIVEGAFPLFLLSFISTQELARSSVMLP